MSSWTNDVDSADDSGDESEDDQVPLADLLREFVEGERDDVEELALAADLPNVDDTELLQDVWLKLDGEKESLVRNRLDDLGFVPEGDEPAIESVDELDDESPSEDEESDPEPTESDTEPSGGPPESPNAMTAAEAADADQRWKILVFGPPKLFKTHLSFTMPEPIAFIDLEAKADDISGKFADKEIRIWQPSHMEADPDTKFRRAKIALDEALECLDWYREEHDQVGSICVDSMSLLWEWAQMHHKIENYQLKDPEEVELSANFGSSQESDWAVIKEYHNREFRERITDSPYHFCWTAMEREAFSETLDEDTDYRVMEPRGEPNNDYKADTVIRARKDRERGKVGDLVGSNLTDNVFVSLRKPTFDKISTAVERIREAESTPEAVNKNELAEELGVQDIINYDPQRYIDE